MPVEHAHAYLVHPSKGLENLPDVRGAEVPLKGKLLDLLNDVYQKSEKECDIDISFNPDPGGLQANPCRTLLVDYLKAPCLETGRLLSGRLASFTTNRSGLGLMFLMFGREQEEIKAIVSRFPANTGILADEDQAALNVAYLERVFMKNAASYKAVLYRHKSLDAGFWNGMAVDRQIRNSEIEISGYWIHDFLDSDFRTTAATGTKRLAAAMREAGKKAADLSVKTKISAAATLGAGLAGQNLTVREFVRRFGLSEPAQAAILNEIKHPKLADEQFRFDTEEFRKQLPYRALELDNGAVLSANASDFDEVFHTEPVDDAGKLKFSTIGIVVKIRLEKRI